MEEYPYGKIADIIKKAGRRAAKYAEGTLVELYCEIGRLVSLEKAARADASFVGKLSSALLRECLGNYGFTARGLGRMAKFYEPYCDDGDFFRCYFVWTG